MDFIVQFAQYHESFRLPELQALAVLEKLNLEVLHYDDDSPFCHVKLPDVDSAKRLIRRSILANAIHQFWGEGLTFPELLESVKTVSAPLSPGYVNRTFKCDVESFRGSRVNKKRLAMIHELLQNLPIKGPIDLKNPQEVYTIFEHWPWNSIPLGIEHPNRLYLGRYVASSPRKDLIARYDLKKRDWISTTSMDAELALITANMALAGPGKIFYDPFAGTGSFPVACAHFGAQAWCSDIDGRALRGEGGKKSLKGNFKQYGLGNTFGAAFVADLTHTPLRKARFLDGIVCDPPYGVREGLMVLGRRNPKERTAEIIEWSKQSYQRPDYVPPKKPYSFMAMLDDILVFATEMLVDNGRLSFWMPTANDEEQEIPVPSHPGLELVALSVQPFYKWSRRLMTYRRLPDSEISPLALEAYASRVKVADRGKTADDLNPFRANYFNGFKNEKEP